MYYVQHGAGRPVVVLHGAGVDHREPEACFEPIFAARTGFRRFYPDLPGMGRTAAPAELSSAEGVLDMIADFVRSVADERSCLMLGHSVGAYYAQELAARDPALVAGLGLVCPLLPGLRDIPEHRVVVGSGEIGDEIFRNYFVIQTPEMLERYRSYVAPAAALADEEALGRIGQRWELAHDRPMPYDGPTLIVAGRLDSTVGYAAAMDLMDHLPNATLAVLDHAGHALPHEQPDLLHALVVDWLARVQQDDGSTELV